MNTKTTTKQALARINPGHVEALKAVKDTGKFPSRGYATVAATLQRWVAVKQNDTGFELTQLGRDILAAVAPKTTPVAAPAPVREKPAPRWIVGEWAYNDLAKENQKIVGVSWDSGMGGWRYSFPGYSPVYVQAEREGVERVEYVEVRRNTYDRKVPLPPPPPKPAPRCFWLPTIAYSLIDVINRSAAATGSIHYAELAGHADYNGHHVSVRWNEFRSYWITEYFWAGRVVLARGTLAQCLNAAKYEYARGAKATTVHAVVTTDEQETEVRAAGFQPWSEEIEKAHYATFEDARFSKVGEAFSYERHGLAPAVGFLANSKTVEEYEAKMEAHFAARRAARAGEEVQL